MSLSCLRSLKISLDLIDPRITGSEIQPQFLQTNHNLDLYALDHSSYHLDALASCSEYEHSRTPNWSHLREALESLEKKHTELARFEEPEEPSRGKSILLSNECRLNVLKFSFAVQSFLNNVSVFCELYVRNDIGFQGGNRRTYDDNLRHSVVAHF